MDDLLFRQRSRISLTYGKTFLADVWKSSSRNRSRGAGCAFVYAWCDCTGRRGDTCRYGARPITPDESCRRSRSPSHDNSICRRAMPGKSIGGIRSFISFMDSRPIIVHS